MNDWRIALREIPGKGTVMSLKVTPRASVNRIEGLVGDEIRVRLRAPPVDGKANEALVQFLCDVFHLSRSSVQLIGGLTGRHKKVLLADCSIDKILYIINNE
jgi:uncharacterized protein (TIGR00251 family)